MAKDMKMSLLKKQIVLGIGELVCEMPSAPGTWSYPQGLVG
jgi:hypothetical protein